mmetsp:Transcript_87015/g.186447  ORF Transcript_87015/g.186447 Transcript_87015/m.186447 type:complete len:200 (+) Transcript_87015:537-1136(+)
MRHHIDLVKGDDEGQLRLVQDRASIQHVRHEGHRLGATSCVHHVAHDSGVGHCKGVADDLTRRRPVEDFDLAWRVNEHIVQVRRPFVEEGQDLVELGSEKIQGRHDAAIRTQAEVLHDLLVIHSVADIDIHRIGDIPYSWVQVDRVHPLLLRLEAEDEAVHESRLPAPSHADHDDHHRGFGNGLQRVRRRVGIQHVHVP